MAGSNMLVKIGLFGAAGWLAYEQGWLSFLGMKPAATTTTPVTTTATTPATTTTTPLTGANSLDQMYVRMVATAAGAGEQTSLNVDGWGYYLNQQLSTLGKVAPDPMPIFQAAISNFDRGQVMTAAQYWAIMAPALKTQLGLSGLGFYGGLGALARRYAHVR